MIGVDDEENISCGAFRFPGFSNFDETFEGGLVGRFFKQTKFWF